MSNPLPDPAEPARVELTFRGIVLGIIITLLFTAASVYLGLKAGGLTFATSIPAAVISMALLPRVVQGSSIYENQHRPDRRGLRGGGHVVEDGVRDPGTGDGGMDDNFPFWMTQLGICAIGGVLGVMYTIPLRRALVTDSDLPYPEGVAGAEVLKIGSGLRKVTAPRPR